ncbi:hypothetical protein [Ktedonospora formicarum]|uniref:Uncharacterized protein n=1 Tax=Ktedonospora formicarum TaxID=2778364 RepID=A0A8J3IGF2_9CHLR|nr:hypothetical protein [Ktedonospora formicarum]GHO50694.1 hypothetical protein KSX_88570 [Ktedonospora formicarum]
MNKLKLIHSEEEYSLDKLLLSVAGSLPQNVVQNLSQPLRRVQQVANALGAIAALLGAEQVASQFREQEAVKAVAKGDEDLNGEQEGAHQAGIEQAIKVDKQGETRRVPDLWWWPEPRLGAHMPYIVSAGMGYCEDMGNLLDWVKSSLTMTLSLSLRRFLLARSAAANLFL